MRRSGRRRRTKPNTLSPTPRERRETLTDAIQITQETNVAAFALHQATLYNAIIRRQHGSGGEHDAITRGESEIIVRVLVLDLLARPDPSTVDGGDGLAVQDGEGRVSVFRLMRRVESKFLFELEDLR